MKSQHSSKPKTVSGYFMKALLTLTILFLLACNNNSVTTDNTELKDDTAKPQQSLVDTPVKTKTNLTRLSVLILPPFDEIANEGISPNIQQILETTFSDDTTFTLINFPYRQLMTVSYQNVFDKKYCSPITDKVKTDFILMTKLNQATRTGQMTSDKWDFEMKIYNTKTGKQFLSTVAGSNLTSTEIEKHIKSNQSDLFTEVKSNR
jgi:hypothetical protein